MNRWSIGVAAISAIGLIFVIQGIRDFRFLSAVVVVFLPFVPTFVLSKEFTGISGLRIMAGLLFLTLTSAYFASVLRPRNTIVPKLPFVFWIYCATLMFGAIHGSFSLSEIPEYFVAFGIIKSNELDQYIQNSLLIPLLIPGSAVAASALAANVSNFRSFAIPFFSGVILLSFFLCVYAYTRNGSILEMAGQESRRYLSGTGYHANEIGLLMNMAFSVSLSSFIHARTRTPRLLFFLTSALAMSAVFLTFSRGAYIGTVVVILVLLVTSRIRNLFFPFLTLLFAFLLLVPHSMVERTAAIDGKADADSVSSGRVDEIWKPLIPDIIEQPLFGHGNGSILWSNAAKTKSMLTVGHPHNAYLAALLDVGLLGSLIVTAFFWHLWRTLRVTSAMLTDDVSKGFFIGAAACVPLLLIQGLTDDSFMPRYTHCFLWLAYGAALGLKSKFKVGVS